MATKTYYIGDTGLVKRLDDVNSSPSVWLNKPLLFSPSPFLKDVKTLPTDGNTVFVVGKAYPTGTFKGIARSTNGGNTWSIPGGNYTTVIGSVANFYFYEVWPIDATTIIVCGSNGYLFISTNGGADFNILNQIVIPAIPNGDVYSVHFSSALVGVAGLNNYIVKTIDGGTTWSVQNGGFQIAGLGNVNGIHISDDGQAIIACGSTKIIASYDGGVSFINKHTWGNQGNHLTWYKDSSVSLFWATGTNNEIVKSIDYGSTWTIVSPYSTAPGNLNYSGAHFYSYNPVSGANGFYSVNTIANYGVQYVQGNFPPSFTFPGDIDNSLKSAVAVWTHVTTPTCYKLTNCVTGVYYTSNTDLSANLGDVVRFSLVNPLSADPPVNVPVEGCYLVETASSCANSVSVVITDVFTSGCAECAASCFLLINCEDNTDTILTPYSGLSDYLGEYIKLGSCPEKCYFVTTAPVSCPASDDTYEIIDSFATCSECIGLTSSTVYELNPRRIKPGFYTPGCPPEYTVKVNCRFSEQYYDRMLLKRYGISVCCDDETDKWTIKKQLLDLKSIYDETLCVSSVIPCNPPCNVTGSVIYYGYSDYCPEPTDLTGVVVIPADPCPDVDDNSVSVLFGYGSPPA